MTEKVSMLVILILLMEITVINCKTPRSEDHIDPTDILNFDQVNMKMAKKPEQSPDADSENVKLGKDSTNDKIVPTLSDMNLKGENKESFSEASNSQITALFRQYVMTLVENLESQVGSESPVNINLRLKVSKHDIYKLKEYGQGRQSDAYEVHEVLTHITQFATKAEKEEFRFYWLEEKLGLSTNNLFLSLALVFSIMLLVKMIQKTMFTFRLVIQIFIIMCFISVIFTWISMYQEVLAEQERNFMQNHKEVCKQSKDQSFWQRTITYVTSQFSFKNDECQEFYKTMFVNPIVKVSPLEAVAVAIVKTIVSPVGIVGTAISTFITATLKDLPLQWQLVVAGFVFVLVFFLICVISGYEMRSIFFSIQRPPRNYHQPIQNVVPPQLLAGVHQNHDNRNVIQNRRQQPIARRPVAPALEGIAAPAVARIAAPALQRIAAPAVERIAAPADTEPVVNLGLPHFYDTSQEANQSDSDTFEYVLDDAVEDICDTLSQQQIGPIVEPNLTYQIQQIEISEDGCGDTQCSVRKPSQSDEFCKT